MYSRFVFDHEGYIGPSDDPYRGLGEAGGDRAVIHPISGRVIYQTATHGVWSFFPSKLLRGDEVATLVSDPATMFDGWTASDERIDDETCGATKFWIDPDTGTIVYRCPGDPDGAYRTDAGTELELGGELVHIGRGGHMLVVRSVLGLDGSHHNVTHVVDAEGNAVAVNSDASAARWIRAAPAGFLMVGQYVDTFWRWHIGYDGSTGTDGIYTVPEGIGRRDSGSIAARCEAILPNGDTVCLGMREAQPVIVQLSVDPDVEPRVVAEIVNDTRGQAQDLLTGP